MLNFTSRVFEFFGKVESWHKSTALEFIATTVFLWEDLKAHPSFSKMQIFHSLLKVSGGLK